MYKKYRYFIIYRDYKLKLTVFNKDINNMNILFFSAAGLLKTESASNRIFGLTKELSKRGLNIYFVTYQPRTNYARDENNFEYCKKIYKIKSPKIVSFLFDIMRFLFKKFLSDKISIKSKTNKNYLIKTCKFGLIKGLLSRVFFILKNSISMTVMEIRGNLRCYYTTSVGFIPGIRSAKLVAKVIKENNISILFTSHGPEVCHEVGARIKSDFRDKILWIADYRDPMEEHSYVGVTSSSKLRRINKDTLFKGDLITTVSSGFKNLLVDQAKNYGIDIQKKTIVIHTGFDEIKTQNFYDRNITNNKLTIIYTGSLYEGKQDITFLFDAIELLDKNFQQKLEIVYSGKDDRIFLKSVKKSKVSGISKSLGLIPKNESIRLQEKADILLLLKGREIDLGVLPGKFFEYLKQKKPILVLGNKDSEFNNIAFSIGGIKIFGYNQLRSLSNFLIKAIENKDDLEEIFGKFNEEELNKYSWGYIADKLLENIKSIIQKNFKN